MGTDSDQCNVVLVGNAGVGKSALVASAVCGNYQEVRDARNML